MKKCQIIKPRKLNLQVIVGQEIVLECRPHRVYFGAEKKDKRPKTCPIRRPSR